MDISKLTPELLGKVLEYPKTIPYGNEGKTYQLNITRGGYTQKDSETKIYFDTDAPGLGVGVINIYELMFKFRDYYKVQGMYLSLNDSIEGILNNIYETMDRGE